MLIDQIKCSHLDKPLEFIRNIHGDEINHLNARSVWKCPDCGKIILRSSPYEKIEQYRVLNLQKKDKIKKLDENYPFLYIDKMKGLKYVTKYWDGNQFTTLTFHPDIINTINQIIDVVNELKGEN